MKRHLGPFGLTLVLAFSAGAETVYTSLQETPVRDKSTVVGSTVIAKLPAGSMMETVKQVGSFTAVSFILDGKVQTGFVATSQLGGHSIDTKTDAEPMQMANGKANELKAANLPTGSEDPGALLTSKLDSLQVAEKDLSTFAKSGKLVARKAKSRTAQ